ncbi:hypothetical protein ACQ4PT_059339 [Festuca glaucescens]
MAVAGPEIVNVNCILDDFNGYQMCIDELRQALRDHPQHEEYVLAHGSLIRDHPLLPEREAEQPKRWMYVNFILQNTRKITLAIRDDDVYVVGFSNQNGRWYELGINNGTNEPFLTMSTFLGCDVQYASILAGRSVTNVTLGQRCAIDAVHRLSSYNADGVADNATRRHFASLIVMISEASRMIEHYNKVTLGWLTEPSPQLGDRLHILLHNWEGMSSAMLERGDFCPVVQNMGITDLKSAKLVVHLLRNSPPKRPSKSERGGRGRGGGRGGGLLGSRGDREGRVREGGCRGGRSREKKGPTLGKRSSSQQQDTDEPPPKHAKRGSPQHQGEEEPPSMFAEHDPPQQQDEEEPPPKGLSQDQDEVEPLLIPTEQVPAQLPHEEEEEDDDEEEYDYDYGYDDDDDDQDDDDDDGGQLADLGRLLVEVFSVFVSSGVVGTISIFDGRRGQIIYNHDGQGDALIDSRVQGNLALTGPYKVISADGRVAIKVRGIPATDTSDIVHRAMLWDGYSKDAEYDKVITQSIAIGTDQNVEVTYAVLSNAVEAAVQVQLKLDGVTTGTARFHGQISAHIEDVDGESVLLFSRDEDNLELIPRPDDFIIPIPLSRSVVVVPLYSSLVIKVKLHAACPPNHENIVVFEEIFVFPQIQQHTVLKEVERSGVAVQVMITSEDIPSEEENITAEDIPPEEENITSDDLPPEEENITSEDMPPEEENITSEDILPEEENITSEDIPPEEENITSKDIQLEEENITSEDSGAVEEEIRKTPAKATSTRISLQPSTWVLDNPPHKLVISHNIIRILNLLNACFIFHEEDR